MTEPVTIPGFAQSIHHYGEHQRQVVAVWSNASSGNADPSKVWVVYIHGGAWRDPTISSLSFIPTIQHVLQRASPSVKDRIAGFASIDYRLSPHPNFPQDKSTPPNELRVAKHPDHIHDVNAALIFLQKEYNVKQNYILVGHSCGATLAFQSVMDATTLRLEQPSPIAPRAILGVCGIYDMRLIRDNHHDISIYDQFVREAFGEDEKFWDQVSPALYEKLAQSWKAENRLAVLASSAGDELVEDAQIAVMIDRMEKVTDVRTVLQRNTSKGTHNQLWEKGVELGELVMFTISEFDN